MDLIVTPADPEPGVKVHILRSYLPHPRIRFMDRSEWASYGGQAAFYEIRNNDLILTPNTTEDDVVSTIIHELTHWAFCMPLTKEERLWFADLYCEYLYDHNERWMAQNNVFENVAYWMEMDL